MSKRCGEHRPANGLVQESACGCGTSVRPATRETADTGRANHKAALTRRLLATGSLAALMAGAAAPSAFATCPTIITGTSTGCTNTDTLSGLRVSNANVTGSVVNNGTIGTGGIFVINSTVTGTTGQAAINNAGTINGAISVFTAPSFVGGINNSGIISSRGNGISVASTTFSGGVGNSGTITANANGIVVFGGEGFGAVNFAGGVTNTGAIISGGNGIFVEGVSNFSGGITNFGSITGTATHPNVDGISIIEVSSFSGGLNNGGTIISARGEGVLVSARNFSGGISNSGTIASTIQTGIAVFGTTFTGGISNSGTVSAANSGILVNVASTFSGGIRNSGTITARGNGIVVGQGSSGTNASVTSFSGGVNNSGKILAGPSNTGIVISGVSIFSGGVSNSGMITGGTGIVVSGVSTFLGAVSNSGTISAANTGIFASNPVSVTNSGTISARQPIALFGGSSTIFNSGIIASTGSTAITFGESSNNVLTIAPSSVIKGIVDAGRTDTFQLGGTGTGSFNVANVGAIDSGRQFQGFGAINKVGDSTWTLTGTNTQALPWTVQQGTLIVSGALTNSPFTVISGVLGGNGTIGALTTTSGGTVAPGNFGTLTVNGNASFGPGSTYRVQTNAAGQSDKIVADGHATLNGGTVQVLAAFGNYAASTQYNILTAQSGLTGTFGNVTSNYAFLTPTLSYDPHDVFLTLTRSAYFSSVAQTPNQRAVAAALDKSSLTNPLVTAVLPQTTSGAQQAYDALSGEIHASVRTTIIDDSRFMRQAMLGRLRQAAYADRPGDVGALGVGGPDLAQQDRQAWPTKAAPRSAPTSGPDLAYWAQGLGAWGRVDGDGNAAGVNRNLAGFLTGFDARFGEFSRVGVAAGYTHSSVNISDRASSAGIDTAHIGAYAGTSFAGFNLRSGAAFAFHTIDTTRTIAFPASSIRRAPATTAIRARFSARSATAWRSERLPSSRSPAPPGCG